MELKDCRLFERYCNYFLSDIKKPAKKLVFKFYGGEAGIRTLGGDKPSTVFKTAAFGHSATSPKDDYNTTIFLKWLVKFTAFVKKKH